MTQYNNNNTDSRRASSHSTQVEPEGQYSDTVDYNTTTTVEASSVSNSDIGNQLNNTNQNSPSSYTQHLHTTMYNHAQQCNNDEHNNHHMNNINNSN